MWLVKMLPAWNSISKINLKLSTRKVEKKIQSHNENVSGSTVRKCTKRKLMER